MGNYPQTRNSNQQNSIDSSNLRLQDKLSSQSSSSRMSARSKHLQKISSRIIPKESYAIQRNYHNSLTENADEIFKQFIYEQNNDKSRIKYIPEIDGPIYQIIHNKATYQGELDPEKKIPQGRGITYLKNGTFYGGNFRDGEAEGIGIYIFRDGSFYCGNFKNGKFDGWGKINYKNKKMICSGYFKDGLPHGQCHQIFQDQTQYKGNFENGLKDGYGMYTWGEKSLIYKGNFKNGQKYGQGVIQTKKNQQIVFYGNLQRSVKAGQGIQKTHYGTMMGNFYNDHIQGEGTFCWKNCEKVYQGNFRKSKMDGKGTLYFVNGQTIKGIWQQGHNIQIQQITNNSNAYKKVQQINKIHEQQLKKGIYFSQKHRSEEESDKSPSEILKDSILYDTTKLNRQPSLHSELHISEKDNQQSEEEQVQIKRTDSKQFV